MINISRKYIPGKDVGRTGYQWCLENGHNPRDYADTFLGKNQLGMIVETLTKEFVSEHLPSELPFFEQSRLGVLNGFMESAREAGDKDTTSYVSKLISQLISKRKQKQ